MGNHDHSDSSELPVKTKTDDNRRILEKIEAERGHKILVFTSDDNRRYYRQDFLQRGASISEIIEVIIAPGTRVMFTKLPSEVKKRLKLRSDNPFATVINESGQIGFVFKEDPDRKYFPLSTEDHVNFEIRSVPNKK